MDYKEVSNIKLEEFYYNVVESLPFIRLEVNDQVVWDDCTYHTTGPTLQFRDYVNSHKDSYVVKCEITIVEFHHCVVHITTKNGDMNDLVGKRVKIINMSEEPQYSGKEGIIDHIDDIGQIHGTWGGCALIPGTDEYIILD